MTAIKAFPICLFSIVLMATSAANANPVGIVAEDVTDATAASLGLSVCQVSVEFDSAADNLLSAAFSDITTDDPAGFHQHPLGGDTAPGQLYVQVFPELAYDSFVTIGLAIVPAGTSDSTALDPDWDTSSFNNSGQTAGGWYNSNPDNTQGVPATNLRVLIGQFTSTTGYNASGNLTVYYNDGTVGFAGSFTCGGEGASGSQGPEGSSPAGPAGGAPEGGCMGDCIAATTRLFVDGDGAVGNDCSSWTCACPDLQTALDCADAGDEIWVAQGTYKPSVPFITAPPDDREKAFALVDGVAIYGGFNGTESTFEERAELFDTTVLSGDIGKQNDDSDNSYHVVVAHQVSNMAVLDGFTVTKGRANGTTTVMMPPPDGQDQGSAVNISEGATPKLENCTFLDNYASLHATVNDHGGATLIGCDFENNASGDFAGGLYTHNGIGTVVTNCQFHDNTAVTEGGGAYIQAGFGGDAPQYTGCTFSGNQAERGGGLFCGDGRSAILKGDCNFSGNRATLAQGGGAVYASPNSEVTITDSVFYDNSGTAPYFLYGGAIYSLGATVEVTNCTFVGGVARYGGAIQSHALDVPPNTEAHLTATNCKFIDNVSGPPGTGGAISGGAIFGEREGTIDLTNCLFVGNSSTSPRSPNEAGGVGGAVGTFAPTVLTATNCMFLGNWAHADVDLGGKGGAIAVLGDTQLTNCLFAGNRATTADTGGHGGALGVLGSAQLTTTNCTFVENWAQSQGGGAYLTSTDPDNTIDNCIFWNNRDDSDGSEVPAGPHFNEPAQVHLDPDAIAATGYTDILGLTEGGDFCPTLCGDPPDLFCCNGNIDDDPVFVMEPAGAAWTDGVYCCATCTQGPECDGLEVGQTKLTATVTYGQDTLMGKLLQPDTDQALQTLIVSNSAFEIVVWGNFEAAGTGEKSYKINNYHFVSPTSPCIDAADNNKLEDCRLDLDGKERFINEPTNPFEDDHGVTSEGHPFDIADMGPYEVLSTSLPDCNFNALDDGCEIDEGLSQDCNGNEVPDECDLAAGTSQDCNGNGVPGECECPADLNSDCQVDAVDLALLLGAWGPNPGHPADLNDDGVVNATDLALLLGAWGACP